MPTTKELISDIIDLEVDKEFCDESEDKEIENRLVIARQELTQKVDNLDWFITDLARRKGAVSGEIDALKSEVARLTRKKKAVDKVKTFVSDTLLPMVVKTMGNNGLFETETARYKLYEIYGPVEVDMENCHKDFVKTEILVKPDKALARKAAIEADKTGVHIDGLSIEKKEKVRRT